MEQGSRREYRFNELTSSSDTNADSQTLHNGLFNIDKVINL
jgi:hypothetical protein